MAEQAFPAQDIYNVLRQVSSNRRTLNPHIFGSSMFTDYSLDEEMFNEIDRDLGFPESQDSSSDSVIYTEEWSLRTNRSLHASTVLSRGSYEDLRYNNVILASRRSLFLKSKMEVRSSKSERVLRRHSRVERRERSVPWH